VFIVLDGLPHRHATAAVTPTLAALAAEGAAATGRAVMTSATYANHATFATGAVPAAHGIFANWLVTPDGPRPAQAVGPAVPTVFDACRAAGRSSLAVLGDQHLIPVMGAAAADEHWPPGGALPAGTAMDDHGYAADRAVAPLLAEALARGADLVVGHLNQPDTAGHDLGPDSEAALAVYRGTDAALAEALEGLRPAWDDTVLVVVSDHDMETVDLDQPAIDLYPVAPEGLMPIPEGNGAVVWGEDGQAGAWLDVVDGVKGHDELAPGVRVVWGHPGRVFALPPGLDIDPFAGQHGGIHTRAQVAVVAGGHPAAAKLATVVAGSTVDAADWAPTLATLLDVELPAATGRSLL
jgi:arylsulfatase A-like enzyme